MQWEFGAPLPQANALPTRTMTYDDDNRLLTFNGQSVVHDNDGNMTSGPLTNNTLTTCVYDARNRLVSAGGLSYGYDPAGNRTAMTNGATATKFVVDPHARLPQVLMRITGGTTNYYVYGLGLLYEVTETATNSSTLTYHYDCRGSTIAITDSSGNIKERFQYSSYGLLSYRSGATDTPFLCNGRYGVMSDRNGLLYMRARYYNPYICRFINPDPVGFAGGLNWYCYADGNPISLSDPMGLWAGLDDLAFAGGGVVIGVVSQGVSDLLHWNWSGAPAYGYSAAAGAAGGWATLYGGPVVGGATFGATRSVLNQSKQMAEGTQADFNYWYLGRDTAVGAGSAAVAELVPMPGIQGLNAGRGSFQAVSRQVVTKLENGTIQDIAAGTAGKMFIYHSGIHRSFRRDGAWGRRYCHGDVA